MAAFATPAELASHLQQNLDLSTATLALDIATGITRNAIGQTISQAAIAAVLHVTDPCEQWLRLPQWPATAVTAVTVGGVAVAATDYTVTPTGLWRSSGWADTQAYRGQPVVVTVAYTGGYATIPDDVKAATLFLAGQLYSNPRGLKSETAGPFSIDQFADALALPESLARQLRATYGTGAYVTGAH